MKTNYVLYPVQLSPEFLYAKVDIEDIPILEKHDWNVVLGYARSSRTPTIAMHRMILGLGPDDDAEVDHINLDKLDNRKGNLRVSNRTGNNRNAVHKRGNNRYRGVYQRSENSFRAIISIDNKKYSKAGFKTAEDGAVWYNDMARRYHGEFAILNPIPKRKEQ